MLLAVAGLAAGGLESVSFGHDHLENGHASHHHHFYFGSHEHPGTDSDHDHDHDHDRAPHHPHHRGDAPRRTATVAAAPALAQPVAASELAASLAEPTPVEPAFAPAPAVGPVARLTPPRAPPSLSPS